MKEQLQKLNNARIGSFGEFVFGKFAQENNLQVFRVHRDRTDFLLNGKKVDIKTRRDFKNSVLRFVSSKIMNIAYIFVVFGNNNVAIYDETKHLLWEYNYERVRDFFEEWKLNKKLNIPTTVWREENDYANIKEEITEFFLSRGLKPRIIYRKNQVDWGDDVIAGNLILKTIREGHVTVFISFRYEKKRDAIDYIVAFPDVDSKDFPLLSDDRLHAEKRINFKNFPTKYRFANIEELFSEFFKRFP